MSMVKMGIAGLACTALAFTLAADPAAVTNTAAPATSTDTAIVARVPDANATGTPGMRPDRPGMRNGPFRMHNNAQGKQFGPGMMQGQRHFGHPQINPLLLILKQADLSKDQTVTKETIHNAVDKLFDQLDTNKDGQLSVGEVLAAYQNAHRQFAKPNCAKGQPAPEKTAVPAPAEAAK